VISALALAALLPLIPAEGPAVVVFGGGSDASSTPASVEDHVLALVKALARTKPAILFNDGKPDARSVQVYDEVPDRTGAWLGRVLGNDANVGVLYRVPRVTGFGAATPSGVLGAIAKASRSSRGAIVIGAGHGRPKDGDHPAAIMLWADGALTARDLAAKLDAEKPKGPLALVLGQCHSGAMTEVMHVGADPAEALARPARCVLAAAPADRTAAGCTPDGTDPDARAYLSLIAAALGGASGADMDKNGRVSLAEAHAYALLNDDTVDLPVKSSETWLQAVLGSDDAPDFTKAVVLARARPEAKWVLEKLGRPELDMPLALRELDDMEEKLRLVESSIEPLESQRDDALDGLRREVLARWPELASPYQKTSRALLGSKADEIARSIEGSPSAATVIALDARIARLDESYDTLEKQAVKLERWIGAYEAVAREIALRKHGTKRQIEMLTAILACEGLEP